MKPLRQSGDGPKPAQNLTSLPDLPATWRGGAGQAEAHGAFPLRIPAPFAARINHDDPNDPLLRQVLPSIEETVVREGFTTDPVGELGHRTAGGLVHKYRGRALLIATSACAIHCRYCFRRHFPYTQSNPDPDWQQTIDALNGDASVSELILSGGDPLSLSNRRLHTLSEALASAQHLKRLRIHTRTPIAVPTRVDDGFCQWLGTLPWPCAVVLHCNHANEVDDPVRAALSRLRGTGVTLLNQAVLLNGVNDTVQAQVDLAQTLYDAGVLPYYLHQLDPVQGAAHFAVSDEQARKLHRAMASLLPGYLLPRLVRDLPDEPSKTTISSVVASHGKIR